MKKEIFVLQIGDHNQVISDLTLPFVKQYAEKIQAKVTIISEDKFPDYPKVYNKFQIYELGKGNDWNIYIDSDALIHPDTPDWTNHIPKDTVLFNGKDPASLRFRFDDQFLKDGRNIGACTWFVITSNYTHNLWKPLEDYTVEEAITNIYPTQLELNTVKTKESLLDDYIVSRNIAMYGLKHKTINDDLLKELNLEGSNFFYHQYVLTLEEKRLTMKAIIKQWGL